jgi:hypothetical protein
MGIENVVVPTTPAGNWKGKVGPVVLPSKVNWNPDVG